MARDRSSLVLVAVLALALTPFRPARADSAWLSSLSLKGPVSFFTTPARDGHHPIISAIDGARDSVRMTMYHLNDPDVVESLSRAAGRGITVRVILDGKTLARPKYAAFADQMRKAGADVVSSSPLFSITHEKALIIDDKTAIIMSMNLSAHFESMRDYGVITSDLAVVKEMTAVFEADWTNARNQTAVTPPLTESSLVWSPVDSEDKLKELIDSARHDIVTTVENLGDPVIQAAFARAAGARGVKVRLIVPRCDYNSNPYFNYPYLYRLAQSHVEARVMPSPESAQHPYMHAKMILVDGKRGYVGSINFSRNSTLYARELGIVLDRTTVLKKITRIFESDWRVAEPLPARQPNDCPKFN